ncbi:MAG TPA: alpha/beta fold hydrolase [Pyrinomonadaceae bacterium]
MKRTPPSRPLLSPLLMLMLTAPNCAGAQTRVKRYEPSKRPEPVAGQPYERFLTRDRFGREITFYLSKTGADRNPLPLVAYIEGSGCGSRFEARGEKIRPAGGHIVATDVFKGSARVLVVEKPGVRYLFQPEGGCKSSAEFNREHTLERWAEANEAAIRAARKLPQIDKSRLLVVGHSEGGLVACRVASELPEIVTHVSTIAGGGASQLFDLIALARKGEIFDDVSPDAEECVQYVLGKWREIESDPTSAEKFFFGFAYRRWSTFLAASPIEELSAARAKIYVAQGTADAAVDPASADALFAQLVSKGKQVTYDRVEGANHSFRIKDKPGTNGWQELFERIRKWFSEA